MKTDQKSLQETYAPSSTCFGCGPANEKGLRIRSLVKNEDHKDNRADHKIVECTWHPSSHHEAFPGMLNGGIIGSLLDCHCNWTAAYTLMTEQGLEAPPCTVTANYSISLKRPTPSNCDVLLRARSVKIHGDRVEVEGELIAGDKVCATCKGLFVAVKKGHPAYHRWG